MKNNLVQILGEKKIAIVGFGKEGQSAYRFLKRQETQTIYIIDQKLSPEDIVNILQKLGYSENEKHIFTGEHIESGLAQADIIIKSPGVSPFQELLLPYREKCISGTQIFFSFYTGKVIGITGTKGKSTISTLTYGILKDAGYKVKLVGNIGTPVLDEIEQTDEDTYDYIIYEMSSFMLQDFSPELSIGFLNNIYPCHLDWHYNSFEIYEKAKLNILRHAEIQIVHGSFIDTENIKKVLHRAYSFGNTGNFIVTDNDIYYKDALFLERKYITLEGKHNLENVCGVLEMVSHIITDTKKLQELSRTFFPKASGLPHRIEHIGTFKEIDFINDSIATTPESTIAAINTFDGRVQTLFLGGQDSGFSFDGLRKKIVASSITHIVAFPDTSEGAFPEIQDEPYDIVFEKMIDKKKIIFIKTRFMENAVNFAFKNTLPQKSVLLSSAAPSFSVWKNYVEKAEEFKNMVQLLGQK